MSEEIDLNIPEGDVIVDTTITPLGEGGKLTEDSDFVKLVYINIKEVYSKEEADKFIKNKVFSNYKQYNPILQRMLVNRVLTKKLLIFRATHDVPVVDAIFCLVPDGNNATWMDVFQRVILPFIKTNQVEL